MIQIMLDKTVSIITGGANGMGAAIAQDFAGRGAKVAIFDLNVEKGARLAKKLQANDLEVYFYQVDVTDKKALQAATKKVIEKFGYVNSWINCAGISKMVPFLESSEELWDATINVNLKATFLCCQVAMEAMIKRKEGTIINISSLSGKKASAWQTIYCASKFGVQGLTQAIAKEFADQGIRVNAICPGIVPTEMWDRLKVDYAKKKGFTPDDVMPYFKQNIPMKRLVDLQDVCNAALFLTTEQSAYLTGQSINLVGGEWMD